MSKGLGQYDFEYAQCCCFWGTEPGKYARLLPTHLSNGCVLDLGAGEGKNAIYLATLGFEIIAVECSQYALKNFRERLGSLSPHISKRIEIVHADVRTYEPPKQVDAVV